MGKIAVDVDDTLYPFTELARQVIAGEAYRTGDKLLERAAYAPWVEWRTPVDLLGTEKWLEIIDLCHSEVMIRTQRPYAWAAEVLTELSHYHELVYVSTRNTERELITREWLVKNHFPSGDFVCSGQSKREHVRECRYMIDDRPKNLIDFVYGSGWLEDHTEEEARIGFGLMTEYNRSLTDVPNIYLAPPGNWRLLRHYFLKTGLLERETVNA